MWPTTEQDILGKGPGTDIAWDAPTILRCAEGLQVHQIQSVGTFAKKSCHKLIDPKERRIKKKQWFYSKTCEKRTQNVRETRFA